MERGEHNTFYGMERVITFILNTFKSILKDN